MKRVLIVEDNVANIELYQMIMESNFPEIHVEYISDAERALERVTKNGFDVIITDFNLSHKEIDGLDIARMAYALGKPIMLITAHAILPRLKLISAYRDMMDFITYMTKPIDINYFTDKLDDLLQQEEVSLSYMFKRIV